MHGLIFETSVCYWQNQPGCYLKSLDQLFTTEGRNQTPKQFLHRSKETSLVLLRGELKARFLMIRMRAHKCEQTHKQTLTCHILHLFQRLEGSHALLANRQAVRSRNIGIPTKRTRLTQDYSEED
jgi:hypothetical protein